MSIVFSQDLSLAPDPTTLSVGGVPLTLNNPIIGYDNLLEITNIQADSEDVDNPILNIANPSTALKWVSESTAVEAQYVTVTVERLTEIDYVGIAGHNFGTDHISVQIEGARGFDSSGMLDWEELSPEVMPADDTPMIFRFTPDVFIRVRIRMVPNDGVPPEMAVVYVGKLLILERRLYVGHRIINYNTRANIVTGRSEQGQFLGRLMLGQFTESQLELTNMTPQFYRNDLEPFRIHALLDPFFFGWRPNSYSSEAGYCWATADMTVSNSLANGFMSASLPIQGIVA